MKNINLLKYSNRKFFTLLVLIVPAILLSAYSRQKEGNKKMVNQSAVSSSKSMTAAADTITINLTLKDFAFKPDTLRIPTGTPVKIMIKNTGSVTHEFMAGVGGIAASGDGFKHDLFHNVTVHHTGGTVEMGDMDMSDMKMGNMKMGGMKMRKMESGFMIDVKPGKQASISFTLPKSKKGTWKMGCFVTFGQTSKTHYDVGMKGVVIVE
jgi:uncharacterized cupredoxin-like copper-binding protein